MYGCGRVLRTPTSAMRLLREGNSGHLCGGQAERTVRLRSRNPVPRRFWRTARRPHSGRIERGPMSVNETVESEFDIAAFLAKPGLGRRTIELKRSRPFSPREIRQTPYSIFGRPRQNHRRFSDRQRGHDTLSLRWRICWRTVACGNPRAAPVLPPPPSTTARRSGSAGRR